jgi:hypothetical protein
MRAQPTPKERPEAFHGIHMHFTKVIAIVIPVVLAPSRLTLSLNVLEFVDGRN